MKFGDIPGIQKPASRIVLGTMGITTEDPARWYPVLDAALEAGINAFDTALAYSDGAAERCLGAWIKDRGIRSKVVLIDKGCHPNEHTEKRVTPDHLALDIQESLARLQTDHIDLYLLHRDDPAVPVGPMMEALNAHQAAGKIRAFGASNWRHERIKAANDYAHHHKLAPFAVSSPAFGLAEQVAEAWPGCVTISGPRNVIARAWYERNELPVLAYSALCHGFFSGRLTRENCHETADEVCLRTYCCPANFDRLDRVVSEAKWKRVTIPQVALAFVLNQPFQSYAVVGASSPEEARSAAAAAELVLTAEELARLDLRRDA